MNVRRLSIAQLSAHLDAVPAVQPSLLRALRRDPRRGVRHLASRLRARQDRLLRETARLADLFATEQDQRRLGFTVIAGVDEVGVAPLAGPVVAAAVILPPDVHLPELNDSKQLTPEQREELYPQIMAAARAVHVGMAGVEEIDRLNILQATRLAHRRAIMGLTVRPQMILIDGRFPADVPMPQLVVIDGDATCASIAAASVVAKVTRDRLMTTLDERYPRYGFAKHKGYGTKQHLNAIRRHGLTPLHRRSFLTVRAFQEPLLAVGGISG
ncbi:MAG TPA: ribonuclease HII [bacterium]